jgi:hypothetical protein
MSVSLSLQVVDKLVARDNLNALFKDRRRAMLRGLLVVQQAESTGKVRWKLLRSCHSCSAHSTPSVGAPRGGAKKQDQLCNGV